MVQPQHNHRPPLRPVLESYVNVTAASYTAKAGDRVIGVNRAGTVTVTLPTAEVRKGRIYTVKDESGAAGSNNITVATEGSETIDGSVTDVISDNYGAKHYYSDGTNWFEVPLLPAAAVAHSATTGQGTDDHHAQAHSLASHSSEAHSELTGVGTDDHHTQAHTIASHSDTTATGTELETLTDGSETTLHSHAGGGGGAVTREGGQTTEATTTSTSAVDLLTAESLTIAALEPCRFILGARKTTGAAAHSGLGLKINTTVTGEAINGTNALGNGSSSNQNVNGIVDLVISPRLTNYDLGVTGNYQGTDAATLVVQNLSQIARMVVTAAVPIATITDIVIRGITGSASITQAADEMHVYSMTVS